jgi:hypothetical protein
MHTNVFVVVYLCLPEYFLVAKMKQAEETLQIATDGSCEYASESV